MILRKMRTVSLWAVGPLSGIEWKNRVLIADGEVKCSRVTEIEY